MIHTIFPMAITKQYSLLSDVMYKKRVIQCVACAQLQTDHFLGSSAVNLKATTQLSPPLLPPICTATQTGHKQVYRENTRQALAALTCFLDVLPGHIAASLPDTQKRRGTKQRACLTVYEQGCWIFCRV